MLLFHCVQWSSNAEAIMLQCPLFLQVVRLPISHWCRTRLMLHLEEGCVFSLCVVCVSVSQTVVLRKDTLHIFGNLPHKLSVLVDVHSAFKWFTHLCVVYSVSHISLIKCLRLGNFSLSVRIQKCAVRKASAFAHGSSLNHPWDPADACRAEGLCWWLFVLFSRCNRISHICKLGPSNPAKQNLALLNENWLTPQAWSVPRMKKVTGTKIKATFQRICARHGLGIFFHLFILSNM